MGKADASRNLHSVSVASGGVVPTGDRWVDRPAKDFWERLHVKQRQTLFTPMKISGGPQYGTEIGSIRVTLGIDAMNCRFYVLDEWKAVRDPHARCDKFVGRTIFVNNFRDAFKLIEREGMGE